MCYTEGLLSTCQLTSTSDITFFFYFHATSGVLLLCTVFTQLLELQPKTVLFMFDFFLLHAVFQVVESSPPPFYSLKLVHASKYCTPFFCVHTLLFTFIKVLECVSFNQFLFHWDFFFFSKLAYSNHDGIRCWRANTCLQKKKKKVKKWYRTWRKLP